MATKKELKEQEEMLAKAVSINPEDMDEGGGLLDNVRVKITDARFEMTDYAAKSKLKRPAAWLKLEEPDGTLHDDQWWSCGRAEDWMPYETEDGSYLIPVGGRQRLNRSSNFGMFTDSLLDCHFPTEKMLPNIKCLIGLEFQLRQKVAEGRDKVKSKDGTKEYDATVACASEIFTFPWEKGGGKSKAAAGKKTSTPSKETEADDGTNGGGDSGNGGGGDETDLRSVAMNLVLQVLTEAGEPVAKKLIPGKVMKLREGQDAKETNKIIQLIFNGGIMEDDDAPWEFDGAVASLG